MINNPEHKHSLVGKLLGRSKEAREASIALSQLVSHFYSQKIAPEEMTRRLNRAITIYSELSGEVAGLGISEKFKKRSIITALQGEGLIDMTNPSRADEAYSIIAKGYDLNRQHWDTQLGIKDRNV